MTTNALRGRIRKIPARMALRALHAGVGTGERKRRFGVIEAGVQPTRRVVALLATLRDSGSDVIRIGRALKIRQMASHTLYRRIHERAAGMALRATDAGMSSSQGEFCLRIVIEFRVEPGRGVMAGCAVL